MTDIAALVAEHDQRPGDVEQLTRKILDKDPQYKFGDVSLAYGKSLADQGLLSVNDLEKARNAREHGDAKQAAELAARAAELAKAHNLK